MSFGPVFFFEVLLRSRRARYHTLRTIYCVVLFMTLASCYQISDVTSTMTHTLANVAASFFTTFAFMQLAAIIFVCPSVAADAIAVERDRRTIEYLLATDLSNADIVLGKLLARMAMMASLILAGLPILSIAMLMGGIAPDHLAMVFLLTFSTLVVVTSLSISVSVSAARARDAIGKAQGIVFAALIIPTLLTFIGPMGARSHLWNVILSAMHQVGEVLLVVNPFSALMRTFSWFGVHGIDPWRVILTTVGSQLALSAVMLAWSIWAVRRQYLKSLDRQAKLLSIVRRRRDRPVVWENGILWKECFAKGHGKRTGIIAKIVGALAMMVFVGVFFTLAFYSPREEDILATAMITTGISGCLVLSIVAARASGMITAEKEASTWTMLLSTPLTAREIIVAKVLGTLYATRWWWLILLAVWLPTSIRAPRILMALPFVILAAGVLAAFGATLGVKKSLKHPTSAKSQSATMGTAFFVGGGYLMCLNCFPWIISKIGAQFVIIIYLAPCAPLLMGYPIFALLDDGRRSPGMFPGGYELGITYVLGVGGYSLASALLFQSAVKRFSQFTDRREEVEGGASALKFSPANSAG